MRKGLPRIVGHQVGATRLRGIVQRCSRLGVRYLTVFAFSTENWRRPAAEVAALMKLFRQYIVSECDELHRNGVRVRFVGNRSGLRADLVSLMSDLEGQTRSNDKFHLTAAVNYGGRDDIVRAVGRVVRECRRGSLELPKLTETGFASFLETSFLPDPDLIVRTSGESRISNFLLWQSAYSELEFVNTLWPDFSPDQLETIIDSFAARKRRFGAVKPKC